MNFNWLPKLHAFIAVKEGFTDDGLDRVYGFPAVWCHRYEAMPHPESDELDPSRVTTLPAIAV
jgi:hypothetical protein